jgi:hypothetical protein
MSYNLVLPTSVEPLAGWGANDRAVFLLNNPNQELRRGTVRLNGLLQVWRTIGGNSPVKVDDTDKITLNPNAGVSGLIRQIQTKFGAATVETINDFGKIIAMKNEAKYYQVDAATTTDSMLELMTYSNDAYAVGDDLKINVLQGLKYPIDSMTSELPFSLDLDICLNSSMVSIPFSRLGEVELSIIFQDIGKTGMTAVGNVAGASYSYFIKNLEVRYITDVDDGQNESGAIVLEVKNEAHIPTILNKSAALEFSPTSAFNSVVCSFLKQGHDSTASNLIYDYLATEAITEQIEYLEVKINGRDDFLKYPLRFATSEILYNYLLAWNVGGAYDDLNIARHGLTYSKLGNSSPSGYGMGVHLLNGLEAGTRISFNLTLKTPPVTPYRSFFFTLGNLLI